jgi:hypothetical protein
MKRISSILFLLAAIQSIVAATNMQFRGGYYTSSDNSVSSDLDWKQRLLKGGMMVVRTKQVHYELTETKENS